MSWSILIALPWMKQPLIISMLIRFMNLWLIFFQHQVNIDDIITYCRSMDYMRFIPLMRREAHLIEFLQFLRPKFGTAVATNRTNTTKAVFEHHNLQDFFDIIISAQDVEHPKPHPESFLKIFQHFGIGPEEALYFGDSSVDQEFARNCGVKLVAFRSPHLEADYYIDSFAQGPELIRRFNRYRLPEGLDRNHFPSIL